MKSVIASTSATAECKLINRTFSRNTRSVVVRASYQPNEDFAPRGRRGRRNEEEKPQVKHFLPLPKPAHLIFIKPTVAVVVDVASRGSVGLKMTAGSTQLERYVVEFYSKRL